MMINALMKSRRDKGQIAIILLFVLVLGLVIYAVVINMGRLAQAKTAVTVASATGAAHAASLVASMGEETWQTRIGGTIEDNGPKNCKVSWKAISYMVTAPFRVIVAAVIVFVTSGGNFVQAIIVAAVALSSGVIKMVNYAISEGPAYMAFRDKALAGMATYDERFVTEAVQVAVSTAVNDFVMLEDLADSDADGRWFGGPGGGGDYVGRYSVVVNEFYKNFIGSSVSKKNYLDHLAELVYPGTDGFGLADKPGPFCVKPESNDVGPDPYAGGVPAQCDPCCVPATVPDSTGPGVFPTRPSGCEDDVTSCPQRAPYISAPYAYTYLYDDPWNSFRSWREKWGVDDDNSKFRKDMADPNRVAQGPGSGDFNFADVPGHHPMSLHRGDVFPFFWIQKENFGLNLNDEHVVTDDDYRCLWCDWDKPGSTCVECDDDKLGLYRGHRKYKQLLLPWDPATLLYDKTYYIPGSNDNVDGNPPLGLDVVVPYPWFVDNWEKGEDRYCGQADTWPQSWPCSAWETDMDIMDWVNYGLDDFLKRAYYFLNNEAFSAATIKDFCNKLQGITNTDPNPLVNGYKAGGMLGRLKSVREKMINLDDQLKAWLEEPYAGGCETAWCVPTEEAEDECWVEPSEEEKATFNFNGGARGEVEDVVACLNWNISGKPHAGPGSTNMLALVSCLHSCSLECLEMTDHPPNPDDPHAYTDQDCAVWRPGNPAYDEIAHQYDVLYQNETSHGNVFKFNDCLENCPENCHDMPRPLVPDFNPNLDPNNSDDAAKCNSDPDDPATWRGQLAQSILEAENQTAKMKLRRDMLLYEVMLAKYMRTVLAEASTKIQIFLNRPDPCSWKKPGQMLTYGWRDPETNRWSIVRAEADIAPYNGDDMLPWLSSGQDWIGEGHLLPNECYELKDFEGRVKVSVTRYDQPASNAPADAAKRTVKLKNDKSIWKFFTARPDYMFSPDDLDNDTAALEGCASYEYFPGKFVEGAFMLNENTPTFPACKDVVENLLKQGIQSSTCAEYGFNHVEASALNKGMIFKFIKCP